MNWNTITSDSDLQKILELSKSQPVLIFKHSTRCSISSLELNRFERNWNNFGVEPFYLDLLKYRQLSYTIAEIFEVEHQSPQLLLISENKCLEHASHNAISSINLNNF